MKKLCKSNTNRMLCGVCAGVAEYVDIDPTIIRLAWALFAFTGAGALAYILAAIIMPEKNDSDII